MIRLSSEGTALCAQIAAREGLSQGAVEALLTSLAAGGGAQAQFSHPELGGMGQWSQGGMVMVGDMFNNALKAQVDRICTELSAAMRSDDLFARQAAPATQSQSQGWQGQSQGGQGQWSGTGGGASLFVPGSTGSGWPSELGLPSSQGAQNNMRYAVFPQSRRLAIEVDGRRTLYDTGDHQIGGVGQQQSGDRSLTFTSQFGTVRVADLPEVPMPGAAQTPPDAPPAQPSGASPDTPSDALNTTAVTVDPAPASAKPVAAPVPPAEPPAARADDVVATIEKLADLHARGVLSDEEFQTKKAELLSRL